MCSSLPCPAIAIPNLLFAYGEAIDVGDFAAAAALFARASLRIGDGVITDAAGMVAMWQSWIKLHNGSPRTRHIISNPIISLSDDGYAASCRSVWTVIQATPDLLLQVVASGRYEDRFACTDGAWHFTERHFAHVDLLGNISEHMLRPVKESGK